MEGINSWLDVQKNIQHSIAHLYNAEEAREIAFFLIQELFGFNKSKVLASEKADLSQDDFNKLITSIVELKKGVPIQYVIGHSYFLDNKIIVNPSVLIPRPETEELVLKSMALIENLKHPKILDVCTGSGCIAISISKKIPNASVWALDISKSAIETAQKTAQHNRTNINFLIADVLKDDWSFEEFDLVISNPPYVKQSEKPDILPHVLNHEPEIALFVMDENPLIFYQAIAQKALKSLKSNGYLAFEINQAFGKEMIVLLENIGFCDVKLFQDMNGKDRMVVGIK
ncbi:MAG: peptide chain release factor N(5)-glutamine methyltransferase [Cytophagales bacterium]